VSPTETLWPADRSLGAPAAILGAIEGVADGLAGMARLPGGAVSERPARRRAARGWWLLVHAVLSSAIGAARAVCQVALLRGGALAARALCVSARNALLVDIASPRRRTGVPTASSCPWTTRVSLVAWQRGWLSP
jgi:hypothetical protein